ncbi:MAG: diguanylate cyclase [bacterium]|nr:diguanylate cyclase [bacterium]
MLIVEDNSQLREMFCEVFEGHSCRPLPAKNFNEAKELLGSQRVDLAVIDYWLPDGNGVDLVRHIKKAQPNAQILFVTATSSDKLELDGLRNEVFAFLPKPADVKILWSNARRALSLGHLSQENKALQGDVQQYYRELDFGRRELDAVKQIAALTSDTEDFRLHVPEALAILQGAVGEGAALTFHAAFRSENSLVLSQCCGISAEEEEALSALDFDGGLVGKAGSSRKMVAAEDFGGLPLGLRPHSDEPVAPASFKKAVIYPVGLRNRILGVLLMLFRDEGTFLEEELALYGSLGRLFSISMENSFLNERAMIDGLTTLYNRGYFDERFAEELSRAQRHGHEVTLCLADLDNFKAINDTYGHLVGDRVLHEVARCFKVQLRTSDFAARYGGEEFVLILAETSLEGGALAAEKIRKAITDMVFEVSPDPDEDLLQITCSFGISAYPVHGGTQENVIHQADRALYRAKAEGGNKVVSA